MSLSRSAGMSVVLSLSSSTPSAWLWALVLVDLWVLACLALVAHLRCSTPVVHVDPWALVDP